MVALTWPKARRQGGATLAGGGGRWGTRRRHPSGWWTKPRAPGNSGRRDGALVTRAWRETHWGRRSPWAAACRSWGRWTWRRRFGGWLQGGAAGWGAEPDGEA
uniref:Uncharacterized protein n=1 Tax=Arundo donax TaxID=35708 RepID=A0A0A9FGU7_ARUDO